MAVRRSIRRTRGYAARVAKVIPAAVPPQAVGAAYHRFEQTGEMPKPERLRHAVQSIADALAAIDEMWSDNAPLPGEQSPDFH